MGIKHFHGGTAELVLSNIERIKLRRALTQYLQMDRWGRERGSPTYLFAEELWKQLEPPKNESN